MCENRLNLITGPGLHIPEHLVEPDAWAGHIPFAFWLVHQREPQVLVELGTHTGNSYFAFCQAVRFCGFNTRCYAVDTWEGDSHAGYYPDDIYAAVNACNEENYADFSTLIRTSFDSAVSGFADASIDLLHIDGLHTYAAVKHDFSTWFPKLSPDAVVLFHDISVRKEDFGVWRLWQELSAEYRNVSFSHSNGLGIIFLGGQPQGIEALIAACADSRQQLMIQQYFQRLGESCQLHIRLKNTRKSNAEYDALVRSLQQQITEMHNARLDEIAALTQCLEDKKAIIALLEEKVAASEEKVAASEEKAAADQKEITSLVEQISILENQHAQVMQSTSWRVTRPLRQLAIQMRQCRYAGILSLKRVYRKLPLSPGVRSRIRSWYYRGPLHASAPQMPASAVPFDQTYVSRSRLHAPLNILLLERSVPRPNQDAGSLMVFNFMMLLRKRGYALTFIPFDLRDDPEYIAALEASGVRCLYSPRISSLQAYLAASGSEYDLILSCRPDQTESVLPLFREYAPQARAVYETHDLHFLREQRQAEIEDDAKLREHAKWRKQQELNIAAAVDCTLVVSENERNILHRLNPDLYIEVIPVIEGSHTTSTGYAQRQDLVFIGGYEHRPNVDAVVYFSTEILPLIIAEIPEIKLHVIGSNPPAQITALACEHIRVHGFVPNIDTLMQSARVSVNPLRYGAGVKGKVVTSMAYGIPCVGTSIAMEGMGLEHGRHALIADDPQQFARAVIDLYRDEQLWTQISCAGQEFIRTGFSLNAAAKTFERIFTTLIPLSRRRRLMLQRHESRADYLEHRCEEELSRRIQLEKVQGQEGKSIHKQGYCFVCAAQVDFYTDWDYAITDKTGQLQPNWREWMTCSRCGFNNRTRASIHLFHLLCVPDMHSRIYLTEQTTPLYAWYKDNYPDLVGSEFLDAQMPSGAVNPAGIRHENLTSLSFTDAAFDYILSFDVLEHIPDYMQAFRECFRTLVPGGVLFFTLPFDVNRDAHTVRAKVDEHGEIHHVLPPEYHGDPLSGDGCLCYYHFGWDMLQQLRDIGFSDVAAYTCWSDYYAYFGIEQIVFCARK